MLKKIAFIISIILLIGMTGCVPKSGNDSGSISYIDITESRPDSSSIQDDVIQNSDDTADTAPLEITGETTAIGVNPEINLFQTTVSGTKPTMKTTTTPTTKPTTQSTINTTTMPNSFGERIYPVTNYATMKAVWVSQFDMQNVFVSSQDTFRNSVQKIILNLKDYGFNTIIFQVRPYADSFYPSNIFPASQFLVSKGVNYDAFMIFLEEAKKQAFSVHAWINPMRGPLESVVSSLDNKYKIKQWWYDQETKGKLVVTDTDSHVYLNPAYQEVRTLIAQGAAEIVEKYNVDGIHFDDYFDKSCFKTNDIADFDLNEANYANFRRDVVSKLVKEIYTTVKSVNPNVLVGVSPAGIISNVFNNDMADVSVWCSRKGYIDYICPQVYFGLEHQYYDFKKVCQQWSDLVTEPSIKLFIGLTLGKAVSEYDTYAGTGKYEWRDNKDVIKRCLEFVSTMEKAKGISVFCYQYMFDPVTGGKNNSTLQEVNNFLPVMINT